MVALGFQSRLFLTPYGGHTRAEWVNKDVFSYEYLFEMVKWLTFFLKKDISFKNI